jgi:hypothetical protein
MRLRLAVLQRTTPLAMMSLFNYRHLTQSVIAQGLLELFGCVEGIGLAGKGFFS